VFLFFFFVLSKVADLELLTELRPPREKRRKHTGRNALWCCSRGNGAVLPGWVRRGGGRWHCRQCCRRRRLCGRQAHRYCFEMPRLLITCYNILQPSLPRIRTTLRSSPQVPSQVSWGIGRCSPTVNISVVSTRRNPGKTSTPSKSPAGCGPPPSLRPSSLRKDPGVFRRSQCGRGAGC